MNSKEIEMFFEIFKEDEYCLVYNGNFIDVVTSKIINITKVSLIQRGVNIRIQNRLPYLIAECFQNIIRHGGHKEQKGNDKALPGFFLAKIRNGFYDVITANLIANEAVDALKKQFDDLNALNKEELKALYNKTLAQGQLSDKGGAGLGLIDMARKSAQKIEYDFLKTSAIDSMFYQRLVMASGVDVSERKGEDNKISLGVRLHNEMMKHNVLVLQKSDFSRDSVVPMLKIVEENIVSNYEKSDMVHPMYNMLVNMIQTVNQHHLKPVNSKECIFFISKSKGYYNICFSCFIDNKKMKWVENFFNKTFSMNDEEIERFYLEQIRPKDASNDVLEVDLGKIIREKFCFSYNKINTYSSLLSIHAQI